MAAGVLGAALVAACGGTDELRTPRKTGGGPGVEAPDGGSATPPGAPDAGGDDAGTPDAGGPDGGGPDGGGPDAGGPDGGFPPDAGPQLTDVALPSLQGWTFYGREQGAPADVYGVTEDEGGNVWVAGGEEGLFLMRKGSTTFERFTMKDGLRPYGYMPDGSEPPGEKYLKVISVAGGPAGTVFVGYQGRPGCEENGHGPTPDPSIYKSGDADKVTLTTSGIKVVHYDIFSGPGIVPHYAYREKLCTIYRLAYDATTRSVWFGGNHGIAWGDADYRGNPTCNGQLDCSGLIEHSHPAFCGANNAIVTDLYYGISPAPNGDVWIGGANRSARFRYMSNDRHPYNFWRAQSLIEDGDMAANRLDIWKDAVGEEACPTEAQRTPMDLVSGMAAMPDGSVWVSSFANGLAHLDANGNVLRKEFEGPADRNLASIARDPADGSLWIGHRYGGAVSRLKGNTVTRTPPELFGELWGNPVVDIQAGTHGGGGRRMLIAFGATESGRAGAVGIYTGP